MDIRQPIEKHVVLAGAGNAHLVALRQLAMRPEPRISVSLVNSSAVSPYSAMVSGLIGGDYSRDEIRIDLSRLCRAAGARLVVGDLAGIDPVAKTITVLGRPAIRYDTLSLSLGSNPWMPAGESAGSIRPLGNLVHRVDQLAVELAANPRPYRLAVVGGGASGCELAMAIHKKLGRYAGFQLVLIHAGERLVPAFPSRAGKILKQTMEARGIEVRLDRRVIGRDSGNLILGNGERIVCSEVLWATNAVAAMAVSGCGLETDPGGFLAVDAHLRSVSHPDVFGTGDGVAVRPYPGLAKNGVHAVRQGKILWTNILASLMDAPMVPWSPQKATLSLLNTADGEALATWGPFAIKGTIWRRWKDRIDRRWVAMFTDLQLMGRTTEGVESPLMRCGGCGSKVSSDVLGSVLKELDTGADARLVVGASDGEDASVHLMDPALYGEPGAVVEVQTVDHFKSFIDDPYLFGRVAALHSVSDIFAMNARPFCALAVATVPYARGLIQQDLLREMLGGACRELKALGVVLSGGHTTEGSELALGLAVTGHGEKHRLFRKGALRAGDLLILTKALGTGAILAAWMRGKCRSEWLGGAVASMLVANDKAAKIFARHDVAACTDVTGFGLVGHLLEMLDASAMGCRLRAASVPVLEGFQQVAKAGILSTLHPDNERQASRIESTIGAVPDWLFDPQTSGGMLAGIPADKAEEILKDLANEGLAEAAIIGEVVHRVADSPPVLLG